MLDVGGWIFSPLVTFDSVFHGYRGGSFLLEERSGLAMWEIPAHRLVRLKLKIVELQLSVDVFSVKAYSTWLTGAPDIALVVVVQLYRRYERFMKRS